MDQAEQMSKLQSGEVNYSDVWPELQVISKGNFIIRPDAIANVTDLQCLLRGFLGQGFPAQA